MINSDNAADPDSIAIETRTLLVELARCEGTTLNGKDVSTIMKRICRCDNGDDLCNLLVGNAPEGAHRDRLRHTVEERVLFITGGLKNGFEKSVEIVTVAAVTKPRSQWTKEDKKALRAEMRYVDIHTRGGKSRLEDRSTHADKVQEERPSGEATPQDIDAAGRKELQYEYDERKQKFVDDIL